MKFIISEYKLNSIVFDYLNSQNFYRMSYAWGFVFWDSRESKESGGHILITTHRRIILCFGLGDRIEYYR